MCIFALFLILGKKYSACTIKDDDNCRFLLDALSQVEEISFCFWFVDSFYHK